MRTSIATDALPSVPTITPFVPKVASDPVPGHCSCTLMASLWAVLISWRRWPQKESWLSFWPQSARIQRACCTGAMSAMQCGKGSTCRGTAVNIHQACGT